MDTYVYPYRFPRMEEPFPFQIRTDRCDEDTLSTIRPYAALDVKDHTVLDIGGHIGGYAVMAYEMGAKEIHSVEPDPENCDLFRRNTQGFHNIHLHPFAATSDKKSEERPFWLAHNASAHSLYVRGRMRTQTTIITIPIHILYDIAKPTTIKLDCEGSEYDILDQPIPDSVTQIIIEFHLNKKHWRGSLDRYLEIFRDWECLRKPVNTGVNWHTLVIYRR